MAFAETTKVPISQTRAGIETMLKKACGSRIVTMDEPTEAIVMFMLGERLIRFAIQLSLKDGDQVRRSRWRALGLVIKAKLESIESGIETVEQAWLANVILPDGQTMAQWAEPKLKVAYERGEMPSDPLRLPPPAQARDDRDDVGPGTGGRDG